MIDLPQIPSPANKVNFGLFEANLKTGELHKSGIRIRIQAQPFRVLTYLLEKQGEVVTREELQQRLWGTDTTVDFDHSLGTAINKLRDALGDSADNPRFIETLSKRGYRFIAPVTNAPRDVAPTPSLAATEATLPVDSIVFKESAAKPNLPVSGSKRTRLLLAIALLLFLMAAVIGYGLGHSRSGRAFIAPRISQITFSGRVSPASPLFESFGPMATDGSRLYFPEIVDGRATLAQTLIADGETTTIPLPNAIAAPYVSDISPDGASLLLHNHLTAEAEQPIWIVPTIGTGASKVPGVLAHDAAWMPDGQQILFAHNDSLYTVAPNGANLRQFATLPGRAFWLRWSPNGTSLRFTLLNNETHGFRLWTITASGQDAHPLFPEMKGSECCGGWAANGREFVFEKSDGIGSNIWVEPTDHRWLGPAPKPYALTNGPLHYQAPVPDRTQNKIYFIGLDLRSELLQYDPASQLFVPFTGPITNASRVSFSRDGKWMAWIRPDDESLWCSQRDGKDRVQLTSAPLQVFMMRWSPDDRQLAIMARKPGQRWAIYTVAASGGPLELVYHEDRSQADPGWSPDGQQIVFGRLPDLMAEASMPKAIYIYDLASQKLNKVPGSDGYFSPRWSPDGRYLAALSLDQTTLALYNAKTQQWKALAHGAIADPVWAYQEPEIYFNNFSAPGQPLYSVNVTTGKVLKVADLNDLRAIDAVDFRFAGLTPQNTPLVDARTSAANIYTMPLPNP